MTMMILILIVMMNYIKILKMNWIMIIMLFLLNQLIILSIDNRWVNNKERKDSKWKLKWNKH